MFQKPLLLFNDFKIGFIYIIEDKKSLCNLFQE